MSYAKYSSNRIVLEVFNFVSGGLDLIQVQEDNLIIGRSRRIGGCGGKSLNRRTERSTKSHDTCLLPFEGCNSQ